MNSKMTTSSQLTTTDSKKQNLSKQVEQEQSHRFGGLSVGRGKEENKGKRYRD